MLCVRGGDAGACWVSVGANRDHMTWRHRQFIFVAVFFVFRHFCCFIVCAGACDDHRTPCPVAMFYSSNLFYFYFYQHGFKAELFC